MTALEVFIPPSSCRSSSDHDRTDPRLTHPHPQRRAMTDSPTPDESPLDPAAALDLAERQQRAVGLSFVRPVAFLYLVWGVS